MLIENRTTYLQEQESEEYCTGTILVGRRALRCYNWQCTIGQLLELSRCGKCRSDQQLLTVVRELEEEWEDSED